MKRCRTCGREATSGFTKMGDALTGTGMPRRMRTVVVWECTAGVGCNEDKKWVTRQAPYYPGGGLFVSFVNYRVMVPK